MFRKNALIAQWVISLAASGAFAHTGQTIETKLLASAQINLAADTITLPLHHGKLADGRTVWYVLTDSSDESQSKARGLVYAPALVNAAEAPHTRTATLDSNGEWVFNRGTVNFAPARSISPGAAPDLFPPQAAQPGSIADTDYSPFVNTGGVTYNAPIIAFDVDADRISFCGENQPVDHSIIHDKVIHICPKSKEVTLTLSHGFARGKPLIYVSLDANNPVAATMEGATYAPALAELTGTASSLPLFAVANGATGVNSPNRQGFDSALLGEGSPLNILTGIPTLDTGYTPLWDIHIGQWTTQAITNGTRGLLTSLSQINAALAAGTFTGFGGGALVSSTLLVNCPAVAILK